MSGGVDSSVAAAMLRDAGHDVVGVTMKLWGGASDTGCCSVADVDDARRVAQQLGIDHHVFNFGDEFDAHVVAPYLADHAAARTPNPCIECNRHVKFDKLVRRAQALGFDAVATGHHARVVERDGLRRIARGADFAKDQSYVLYMLTTDVLARVLLPLGALTKAEVRAIASGLGLRTARKPDSQDVCFITSTGGRRSFVGDRIDLHPGDVVDRMGTPLGRVDAVELVTVGQRRGLGLSGGDREPRFAVDVDVARRRVVVGTEGELLSRAVALTDLVWAGAAPTGDVLAQRSAHGRVRPARFEPVSGVLTWDEPQRRVAAGQSVVLYDAAAPDEVLGGGRAA
jgi:tRNA-specific 2-thiouridylase